MSDDSYDTDDTGSERRDAWERENDASGTDGDASRGSDGAASEGSDVDYSRSPGPNREDEDNDPII